MYKTTWGDKDLEYGWWSPAERLGAVIAIDTETRLINGPLDVPDLALTVVSDGVKHRVIAPGDEALFLACHQKKVVVAFNLAFDFWVLDRATSKQFDRSLWDMCDQGRLLCSRMLYRLLRLAETGDPVREGTLADVCRRFAPEWPVDKEDPYRMRYGELVGLTREQIEAHPERDGFLGYAIRDAVATWHSYKAMHDLAVRVMRDNGWGEREGYSIRPDAYQRWGPLSLAIQSRAAVAFARLSREPLLIDEDKRLRLELAHREELTTLADKLEAQCPGLWKRYKRGAQERKVNKATGLPQMDEKVLQAKLEGLASQEGKGPIYSTGKEGGISTSATDWASYLPGQSFVCDYDRYEHLKKRLSVILIPMRGGKIYAKYEPLLKTGRTSASKHRDLPGVPVQQVPRAREYRELVVPSEGSSLLTIDYSYVELRTLAANCKARFGESKLFDAVVAHTKAVRAGVTGVPDPHEVTAAFCLGITPGDFMLLPKDQRKRHRQAAKAVNFGYPGGLGYKRFVSYANGQYGTSITEADAKKLKEKWLDVYPEMRRWLADTTESNLSRNLCLDKVTFRGYFGVYLWRLREVILGSLPREECEPLIERLYRASRNPEATSLLAHFDYTPEAHEELEGLLLKGPSVTLTGRVRGRTGYCDGANHPFQALAADGGKEAIWRLLYGGYKVKGFIHDEVIVELPKPTPPAMVKRVHQILNGAMEDVCGHGMPVETESHLGDCWEKG